MEIQNMSVEALKAAAYDNIAQMEQCQYAIKAINAELSKRANAPKEEPKPETPA